MKKSQPTIAPLGDIVGSSHVKSCEVVALMDIDLDIFLPCGYKPWPRTCQLLLILLIEKFLNHV
jgi:hypothetical protein